MKTYRNLSGRSGVSAYARGLEHIDVQFKSGAVYRYTTASAGRRNIRVMKRMAEAGEGLARYITSNVRNNFESIISA